MGCGRVEVRADCALNQTGVLVAGFEAFELFESGVPGAAGGVDAVLEAGERLVASPEGIGAPV
jgi:hypothetical protein